MSGNTDIARLIIIRSANRRQTSIITEVCLLCAWMCASIYMDCSHVLSLKPSHRKVTWRQMGRTSRPRRMTIRLPKMRHMAATKLLDVWAAARYSPYQTHLQKKTARVFVHSSFELCPERKLVRLSMQH